MQAKTYKLKAKVWKSPGFGGWHFVTVPHRQSAEITKLFGDQKRGWGSLPVKVKVGKTTWLTSVFPDKKIGAYLMGIKAVVRKKENIRVRDEIALTLEIQP